MTALLVKHAVRQRDGFRCVHCGMTNRAHLKRHGKALHVHRKYDLGGYSLENCETLCYPCHGKTRRRSARKPPDGYQSGAGLPPRLVFHLPREWAEAFRAYVQSLPPPRPNESEHLRAAFQEYLEKRGVSLPPIRRSPDQS